MINFDSEISEFGDYLLVTPNNGKPKPCVLDANHEGGLYWINHHSKYNMIPDNSTVVIGKEDFDKLDKEKINQTVNLLIVDNPRLTYAKVVTDLYKELYTMSHTRLVDNTWNKMTGHNVHLGENVKLGYNVKIGNNVTIYDNVTIGNNVVIGDNTVIGTIGIGFERLEDGTLFKFPQIGGVIIGNDIEIGTHCDIKRGTLGNTIISDGCKIGSYNNIGHNTFMGENCLITVKCLLCGSSSLGNNVTMGTQSSVKENIKVPDGTTIGGMAFVTKNYKKKGETLIGVPAKPR